MGTGVERREIKGVDCSFPTVDQSHGVSRNPRSRIDAYDRSASPCCIIMTGEPVVKQHRKDASAWQHNPPSRGERLPSCSTTRHSVADFLPPGAGISRIFTGKMAVNQKNCNAPFP